MPSSSSTVYTIQPELFEPQSYLDCDTGPGFFSLLVRTPDGAVHPKSYELGLLPRVITAVNYDLDTWISQASFLVRNRRAVSLRAVGLLFSDLDTYKTPSLQGKSPDELLKLLFAFLAVEGIPRPSTVLFSGRGLQAKWLLTEPVHRAGIMVWNDLQRALGSVLDGFGSDAKARDVSRVLRLEKTVNTKSGEVVRVIHVEGSMDAPVRYNLDAMAEILLPRLSLSPLPPPSTQEVEHSVSRRPETFSSRSMGRLAWDRLEDIRTLWRLRGGVKEGYRETTLFWLTNFLFLAAPLPVSEFWREAQALAAEVYPGEFYRDSDLSTVYRKAQEYRAGSRIIFRGRMYPPLYTPKNETLAEVFEITGDEERHLATIISKPEKLRRLREKRWSEGVVPQSQRPGATRPWEAFGISRRTWYRRGSPSPSA